MAADKDADDVGLASGQGQTEKEEQEYLVGFVASKERPMPFMPNYAANMPTFMALAKLAGARCTKDAGEPRALHNLIEPEDEEAFNTLRKALNREAAV